MRWAPRWRTVLASGAIAVLAGGALAGWTVDRADRDARRARAESLTGGRVERAVALINRYGCSSCHAIPGIRGPRGLVGPALGDVGKRVYIAGVLTNSPHNMVRWIVDPPAVDPLTAMPATGISEAEARDVAAYLYSLR